MKSTVLIQTADVSALELIYNLHPICETLVCDGLEGASYLFDRRLEKIASLNGGQVPLIDGMILITSLNRSLYDFFQFYLHVSFTKCCYENRVLADRMQSQAAIRRAGIKVLSDYSSAYAGCQQISGHMKKARCYIQEHLADKLTLDIVGKNIHISGNHLGRIFPALTGQSFCDYVREERLKYAGQLLLATSLGIDEIAARSGFSTPNYFARVFKKYVGRTPSDYRRAHQNRQRSGRTSSAPELI